jgi:hypothetical protein
MSGKPPKRTKRKHQIEEPHSKKTRSLIIGSVLGLATVLGVPAALLTLLPRISVASSDPVDPNDTLSASFTISNNNFIPLRHVTATLLINEVQPFGVPLDRDIPAAEMGSGFVRPAWTNHSLDMDDKFTVSPSDIVHFTTPREASIAILVSYQPWIVPWTRRKVFRFATHRQTDGKLYWYSLPAT